MSVFPTQQEIIDGLTHEVERLKKENQKLKSLISSERILVKKMKLEIEIPEATEEDKALGWKYNCKFMEKLSDKIMKDSSYSLQLEEIETVLTALFELN